MIQVLPVVPVNFKNLFSSLSILCLVFGLQSSAMATVELDYFQTKVRNNDNIILSWGTTSEQMNLAFKIYVSRNGRDYTEVGTVAGFGTTSQPQSYQYTYEGALPGRTYFKLIQINESYRSVELERELVIIGRDNITLIIAPNPVFEVMSINSEFPLTTEINIFNTAGQMVRTIAPQRAQNIFMGDLPNGLYMVVTEYGTKKVQVNH